MLARNFFCRFISIIIFLVGFLPGYTQSLAVIHMQTENNLPYEVRLNGKNYPSSQNGYLMIPDVPAGNQILVIEFSPEISLPYQFTVQVMDKSRGFSLRQEIDNTWRLFDLTEFTLMQGQIVIATKPVEAVIRNPVENLIVIKKETPPVLKERFTKPAIIQKIFDKTGTTGIDQVYIITNGAKTDTIAVFIPDLKEDTGKPATDHSTSMSGSDGRVNKKNVDYFFTAAIPAIVNERLRKTLSI